MNIENVLDSEVKILNIFGQEIYNNISNVNTLSIDVSNFAKGVYIVNVTTGKEVLSSKIVVEK